MEKLQDLTLIRTDFLDDYKAQELISKRTDDVIHISNLEIIFNPHIFLEKLGLKAALWDVLI